MFINIKHLLYITSNPIVVQYYIYKLPFKTEKDKKNISFLNPFVYY